MTNALVFDRYCAEIIEQTRLFRDTLKGVKLDTRVPTCPDWTLRDLAVHLGNGHRRAAEVVRKRATSFIRAENVPGYGGPADLPEAAVAPEAFTEALSAWLSESAQLVSDELRVAGEDSRAWTLTGEHRASFWARRRTHETLVHRADAALAKGSGFEAPHGLAADCVDEFLELTSSPEAMAQLPGLRSLADRSGDTLHLHATDTPDSDAAEWLVRLEGGGFSWLRAHEKATTAVRGPLSELLLVLFRRRPPGSGEVEVLGDARLLDFWLERVGF
ncbi:hypothetical protein DB35_23225 [Streptomyces abyssalis]|uniref:Mycothiol-dependent maleylpyruvate isomerase metal-binding domain-containing protein n=1 Tax=Streptomyces abyssalis TaxID=933944 RepID=A0A1E7JNZ4_9ACTN|nr:maleylpyruvate isomerase family mycothiol-dependent enzyme [Streptomyces abyssalis]OEU86609.1 hypothetical protein DB35_23225 [Streptomyces abyssalis]OEU90002.1 hypothetical protein AN215_10295 [Streptomyces abyssalis]OEV27315.1 hypothetical protein AN219_23215 [Streptomyces nanshensis]